MKRNCPNWILIGVVGLLLMGGMTPAVMGERASAAHDATEDLLKQIDSAAPSPSTAAARPGEDGTAGGRFSWLRLIRLFAPALATAAALAIAGGVAGVFVLFRRESLLVLAMPQVVAVGAAIGMRMGWPTLPPALVTAGAALGYLVLSKRWGTGNWLLPALYVAGLSVSFLIIASRGQDVADLQNLFVGIDVAVSPNQAFVAVPILLIVAGACAVLWRRWLLMAQAPAAAELAGLHPARWDALFLALLTAVILLGTHSLGVVMVLAMLFLPAATVLPWVRRVPEAMVRAAVLALVFLAAGFYVSNVESWPFSQSVGGVGFVGLVVSHAAARLAKRV